MKPTLGHFVGTWLPRSETFTYGLIRRLTGFSHRVFTTRTENLDLFPIDHLDVAPSEDAFPAMARRHGVDLALGHFGPRGLTALPVALANDIPAVTIFHGYDVSMLLRDPRWLERYRTLLRFGTHALCVSDVGRQRLLGIGCPADRVSTVHLGVDLSRFPFRDRTTGSPGGRLRVLMVARLAEKKGADVALAAVRLALDRGLDLALRIVGDGERRADLERQHAALALGERATFVGPLDGAGVRRELETCDVLIQPSVTAANGDQEGIPVALMEAMASGVPVVATRHSGIPELVLDGRTGLLVEERDADELTRALARLAADRPMAGLLAHAARRWIEREFNLAVQAPRIASVLHQAIADHRAERMIARRHPRPAGTGPRLLYLRGVPVPQALTQLAVLARRHPDAAVSVLTAADTREMFERCGVVDRVFTFTGGRMRLQSLNPGTFVALRGAGYDRVIVPYARESAEGYENVEELAFACGTAVVAMPPSHREILLAPRAGVAAPALRRAS